MKKDSLNLVGDGDDLDVIADVERTFGISIGNKEAETTLTVGHLYDLIQAKCGTSEPTQSCFSQIAFYRLRRALGSPDKITPETSIDVVRQLFGGSIATKWKELGRQTGLSLPRLEAPSLLLPPILSGFLPLGKVALVAAWLGVFVFARHLGIGSSGSFWIAIGVPLVGFTFDYLWHLIFGDIPRRIATIGDLAREAAGHSFSDLSRTKPKSSAADRWYALLAILRQISGHQLPISRDTTFFQK